MQRRQAPADGVKPAPVPGITTLPESLDLGDRLAEKLKAQQERLMAHVGNFTCVLRETRVLNERNELDLEVQKRALEQYSLPSEWFKKRLIDTYETCNKVSFYFSLLNCLLIKDNNFFDVVWLGFIKIVFFTKFLENFHFHKNLFQTFSSGKKLAKVFIFMKTFLMLIVFA